MGHGDFVGKRMLRCGEKFARLLDRLWNPARLAQALELRLSGSFSVPLSTLCYASLQLSRCFLNWNCRISEKCPLFLDRSGIATSKMRFDCSWMLLVGFVRFIFLPNGRPAEKKGSLAQWGRASERLESCSNCACTVTEVSKLLFGCCCCCCCCCCCY